MGTPILSILAQIQGEALQVGIRWLMVGFTIAGILIVILLLSFFPLHGKRLKDVKEQIAIKETCKKLIYSSFFGFFFFFFRFGNSINSINRPLCSVESKYAHLERMYSPRAMSFTPAFAYF